MDKIRVGVIGVGNMGSKYAQLIADGSVEGMELAALTRVRGEYRERLKAALDGGLPLYDSADALFEAVESGQLSLDAVVVATPHYAHEEQVVRAFENLLHVLCDKPAGVYSRQARQISEALKQADGDLVYAMVFNQRTNPLYGRMKEIVESGRYGRMKRVNWVVTDWYRPDFYYASSAWRATWDQDGGGTLLNQCPHNLDLLQWICGVPARVQGFCHEGKYHPIQVEDDVTAYLEWDNGATGVFIASTGEAAGVNRLEISLEEALLVCEGGELRVCEISKELGMPEAEYRRTATESFRKINGAWHREDCGREDAPYLKVLQGFADAIRKKGEPVAWGEEGRYSLYLSNAIYLSSWQRRMIELPKPESAEELQFEKAFEEGLRERIKHYS
ncbi:MAG: Gfo/Idh/MocA family oxidoreductase [Candidatus Gastranaerophilales bacterium]|nr:Gfo/Idh/MocA family oxidoreductase [Candidatus Gastranaerophilales bacterium]